MIIIYLHDDFVDDVGTGEVEIERLFRFLRLDARVRQHAVLLKTEKYRTFLIIRKHIKGNQCRAVSANLKKCGISRTLLRKLWDFGTFVRDFPFDIKYLIFDKKTSN